jgi:hypothetical protein
MATTELINAKNRLADYVHAGINQGEKLLQTIKDNVITPYRVYTHDMSFVPGTNKGDTPTYCVRLDPQQEGTVEFNLHRHALGQMAGEIQVPLTFVNTLTKGADWERRELSDLLNERFHKLDFKQRGGGNARFITLAVGKQVRGFVSRSFKRHLRSGPIFHSFINACIQMTALPVEAVISDLCLTLRCVVPNVIEVNPGTHIAIGLSCSNSDFGAGTFRIGITVLNLQTGVITYLHSIKEERHVGAAEKDDGQSDILTDDTIAKKMIATQSEVQDIVKSGLNPDRVDETVDLILSAMDKEISWSKFVSYMQGKLSSDELKELGEILKDRQRSGAIADIAYDGDDQAILTLWWASNAVGEFAKRYEGDKKDELQVAAGSLLTKRAPAREVIS